MHYTTGWIFCQRVKRAKETGRGHGNILGCQAMSFKKDVMARVHLRIVLLCRREMISQEKTRDRELTSAIKQVNWIMLGQMTLFYDRRIYVKCIKYYFVYEIWFVTKNTQKYSNF